MANQVVHQAALWSSMTGLSRLVQSELLRAAAGQQQLHSCITGGICRSHWTQHSSIHTSAPAAGGDSSSTSSSSNSSSSSSTPGGAHSKGAAWREQQYKKRLHAYKSRLPRARKYGPALRDVDPAAFEQMRLVVGYYDLPENRDKQRPPSPSHVTINNLQTLLHTRDVDPYYKLALLSYRSKLQNAELLQGMVKTRSFLSQLSAPPDFVPAHLEELTTAALQQQKQQQQAPETAQAEASSSSSSNTTQS